MQYLSSKTKKRTKQKTAKKILSKRNQGLDKIKLVKKKK